MSPFLEGFAVKLVFGFIFGFVTVLSLLPHALSEPRVDAGRCPEVIVSFSETSGQDHMVLIVIVFIFRALLIHLIPNFRIINYYTYHL